MWGFWPNLWDFELAHQGPVALPDRWGTGNANVTYVISEKKEEGAISNLLHEVRINLIQQLGKEARTLEERNTVFAGV